MSNMQYIDDYFNSQPCAAEKQQFEQRINNDISFAEEVAFYIAAQGTIKETLAQEKKIRFKEIYRQQHTIAPVVTMQPVRKLWKYMAAAGVLVAVMLLTWVLTGQKTSPQQLADIYIAQNFKTLPVKMTNQQDSLQTGIGLYQNNQMPQALEQFETILKKDPENIIAKRLAGIVSLRLLNYDKALIYFTSLEKNADLVSKPDKFYHALTLLKRNNPGDKAEAALLLKEVVAKDLDERDKAVEWLEKLE
jgi:tetratricopeptide (TPR) repeat protein